MKELEKTKRISIATTLFILAVLIGFLTYNKPKNVFPLDTKNTLENVANHDYFITIDKISDENMVLIDIRNGYEFEKGTLENAKHIHTPDFLSEENLQVFKELKEANKTIILFGNTPEEVNLPFMLLYQLGYDNMKLLTVELGYHQNKLIAKNYPIETSKADVAAFIQESVKKQAEALKKAKITVKPKVVKVPKKVITVKKKKKMPMEGGC